MRVWVDADLCQASGYCTRTAPEVFHEDADGIVTVHLDPSSLGRSEAAAALVPTAQEADVRLAAIECPAGAITVIGP